MDWNGELLGVGSAVSKVRLGRPAPMEALRRVFCEGEVIFINIFVSDSLRGFLIEEGSRVKE